MPNILLISVPRSTDDDDSPPANADAALLAALSKENSTNIHVSIEPSDASSFIEIGWPSTIILTTDYLLDPVKNNNRENEPEYDRLLNLVQFFPHTTIYYGGFCHPADTDELYHFLNCWGNPRDDDGTEYDVILQKQNLGSLVRVEGLLEKFRTSATWLEDVDEEEDEEVGEQVVVYKAVTDDGHEMIYAMMKKLEDRKVGYVGGNPGTGEAERVVVSMCS
ncbi:hypothetical protein T440DRAFT_466728 [Plenodomus tracheiphilus IPT5]|uniref:Uncharacterized protein n=1 Tax=Plenodomus tracheiphilus IPT5 TaxID=1408161 RepID=A0A6A7BDZ6_9PLEO|nr:hypothetical protein T440DRAFT_466728 [Plenodomus tracheiphilus IPT5]